MLSSISLQHTYWMNTHKGVGSEWIGMVPFFVFFCLFSPSWQGCYTVRIVEHRSIGVVRLVGLIHGLGVSFGLCLILGRNATQVCFTGSRRCRCVCVCVCVCVFLCLLVCYLPSFLDKLCTGWPAVDRDGTDFVLCFFLKFFIWHFC